MPIHDWTRVNVGTFHDFHGSWITHITETLNAGLLPPEVYAQSEQRVRPLGIADVLALRRPDEDWADRAAESPDGGSPGGTAVADSPPRVARSMQAEASWAAALKQRRIVVRHVSGHRVVAVIEIVSPGNKDRQPACRDFVEKSVGAIDAEIHLLLIDLFPPGPFDPGGLHRAIWNHYGERYDPPAEQPLIAVGYQADDPPTAYLAPLAVGDAPPTMPLFFALETYINLPLAPSYDAAYAGVPAFWRAVVEGREPAPGG